MKAVLFDCDGTVYQDLHFHEFYLSSLGIDAFFAKECAWLIDAILEGKYLKMNTWIQIPEKTVRNIAEMQSVISEIVSTETSDGDMYLGDCWSLCTLFSILLGIDQAKRQEAFYATRAFQAERLFKDQALIEALRKIRKKAKIYLMTNSPEDTASDFIKKLGLIGEFDAIIYDAHKPVGLIGRLYQINPDFKNHLDEVITVGDHYYNDLMHLKEARAYTVWMNPYPKIHKPNPDLELTSLDDLIRFLNRL